jgi:hypothetical protein
MKRMKRNNIWLGGNKTDLNYPGFFKLSLEHYYTLWLGIDVKVEIKEESDKIVIRLYRTWNDSYTEQKDRTYTGNKPSEYVYILDKYLILGVGNNRADLKKYDHEYGVSYYHIKTIFDEYKIEAKKNHCLVPSDMTFTDCKEYLELNLLF